MEYRSRPRPQPIDAVVAPGDAPPETVPGLVGHWVRRKPDHLAVRDALTGQEISYRELWQRSGWLAGALADLGVGRGDLVAVAQDRSIPMVVAFLGILRAGAAYLPLDPMAPAARLAGILQDAGTDVVVCSGIPRHQLPPGLRRVRPPERGPDPTGMPELIGDDPAYVAFTSGSTGRPKGVVVPHRAIRRLSVGALFCSIEPGARVGNAANPAFDATTFEIWNPLVSGGAVVVLPSLGDLPLDDWIALIRSERLSALFLTTSLFHTLARERPAAFATLDTLVVGGEQLELSAVRRVLAARPPGRLVNGYGPTETTTFAAYFDCTPESVAGLQRIPIGFPLQDTGLFILDEQLAPVPDGDLGELCVGGPGVALGYLGRPELTAEKFVTRPKNDELVYRTGDLARVLPGGALEVMGRRDRQVKLRGFRIELEEIERAAVATGLLDAAFVEKVGEGPAASLVGFALPAPGGAPARDTLVPLRERLAARLPQYMLPTRWLVLDQLPIGPTGKTDRAALLTLLEPAGRPGPADAEQMDRADGLAVIWRDVLGVAQVGPADNFIDLGGNSILAMQAAARIQQYFERPVDAADVLLADTLTDLRARVERSAPTA